MYIPFSEQPITYMRTGGRMIPRPMWPPVSTGIGNWGHIVKLKFTFFLLLKAVLTTL